MVRDFAATAGAETFPYAAPLLLAVAGAIVGSFLATLALRQLAGRSAIGGRSACDRCGRTLRWHELLPLLSALLQRGRCRRCGGAIHPAHWMNEATAATIGLVAGTMWATDGWTAAAAAGWAMFALLLLPPATTDLMRFRLPLRFSLLVAAGGLALGSTIDTRPVDGLIGGAAALLLIEGTGWVWQRATGRAGFGGGDGWLLGAIGLWLGWQALPALLLGTSLTGFVWIGAQRLRRGRTPKRVPLGAMMVPPALVVAAVAAGAGRLL